MPLDSEPQEMERSTSTFSTNLDILMTRRGMHNAGLGKEVGVSREMVGVWRQGKSLPVRKNCERLAAIFEMSVEDLLSKPLPDDLPPMLPMSQWAKREKISVNRAKSLFDLGILTGTMRAGTRIMVPAHLRAPENSKHLVRLARRPPWVDAFCVNLDRRMRELEMQNQAMADAADVTQSAVTHWRSGRGFPRPERLAGIAKKLGWSEADLIREPGEEARKTWKFRFGHASFDLNTDAGVSEAA